MWYRIRDRGSTVCRWGHCVRPGWRPADISAGNDSTAHNNSFLSNICHQSPSTCCNRSFISFLFLFSSSLPNCWNSPVIFSLSHLFPALQSFWIPLIPSPFLSSLLCQPCSWTGRKKKEIFSPVSRRGLVIIPLSLLTHSPIIVCLLHLFISPSNTSLLSSVPFSYFLTVFITSFFLLQQTCLEIKRKTCSSPETLNYETTSADNYGQFISLSKTKQRILSLKDFFYCILQ